MLRFERFGFFKFSNFLRLAALAIFALTLGSSSAFADQSADNSPVFSSSGGWTDSWCLPPFGGCGSVNIGGDASVNALNLPGTWSSSNFTNSAGTRKYYLYIPKNGSGAALP